MPLNLTCPHCGKNLNVADQYAGQTGPCPACGQTVRFPSGNVYANAPPAQSSSGPKVIIIILVVLLIGSLMSCGCLAALLLPAVQAARGAARRSLSTNNLKQIGLAIHNYHDTYKQLPPAVVRDANGKPLYSGRVLLLPFLDQSHLAGQWDHSQAWDSPANQAIAAMRIKYFEDPAAPESPGRARTDYLFITGKGTFFDEGKSQSFANAPDGLSNTIYIIEQKGAGVSWAEPRDIDVANGIPMQGNHRGVVLAGFLDGSVTALSVQTPPETMRALSTSDGGEVINLP